MIDRRVDSVSQSLNDRCSSIARAWAETTLAQPQLSSPTQSDFSHAVMTSSGPLAITSDGIGTKVEIAERMTRYETLGFDLVAMVVDDLVAGGARPVALSNILDVDRLDEGIVDELMRGLAAAARTAGIVVAGGEIAQLGQRISGYGPGVHINWCATAIGIPHVRSEGADRPLRSSDCIIALASDGFRSNGFTLARSILDARFGSEWHLESHSTDIRWGDCLLTPSRIVAPAVMAAVDAGVSMLACAHVTGGGIPGNLPRILAGTKLRAELNDLWPPHCSMLALMEMADIAPNQAYEQWNMGTGFLCVVPKDEAIQAIRVLEDAGVHARIAGTLVQGTGIRISAHAWDMGELLFGGEG